MQSTFLRMLHSQIAEMSERNRGPLLTGVFDELGLILTDLPAASTGRTAFAEGLPSQAQSDAVVVATSGHGVGGKIVTLTSATCDQQLQVEPVVNIKPPSPRSTRICKICGQKLP